MRRFGTTGREWPNEDAAGLLASPGLRLTHHVYPPQCYGGRASRLTFCASAFTLVELLLVMTLLIILVSLSAPTLANFFRGRTLDSEARRLLALTHHGQSRAVAEGVPILLWVDTAEKSYGLKEEPGWADQDPRALEFSMDKDLQIEVIRSNAPPKVRFGAPVFANNRPADTERRDLPEIRFLPDGFIGETSPLALRLFDRDGVSIWLAQSTNHLNYEIRNQAEQ